MQIDLLVIRILDWYIIEYLFLLPERYQISISHSKENKIQLNVYNGTHHKYTAR